MPGEDGGADDRHGLEPIDDHAGYVAAHTKAAELIVLPDEPHTFSETDGPECFHGRSVALDSGRHLTWYGPSMVNAVRVLVAQLSAASQ